MRMLDLSTLYEAPIDPSTLQYKAVAARKLRSCSGGIFDGQRVKVCREACEIAKRAGLPDCDDIDPATGKTFIYTLRETDPRQLSITDKQEVLL